MDLVARSGVARVAELGGQAGGNGLHQGGKRIRMKIKGPTAYRPGGLRAHSKPQMLTNFRLIYHPKTMIVHHDYQKYNDRKQDVFMSFFFLHLNYCSLN